MKYLQHPRSLTIVTLTAIALTTAAPVWAIRDGIPINANSVITNPFVPQKTVEAWKLVGHGGTGCSGIRISKEWVMAAGHCPHTSPDGLIFSSELGTAQVDLTTCASPVDDFHWKKVNDELLLNDLQICRLANPGALSEPSSYPVLAVVPTFDTSNAGNLGALLIRGLAKLNPSEADQIGVVDLNGVPLGQEAATINLSRNLPYVVGGDSGGGAYWLPPNGQDAALVGIISTRKSYPGGLAVVPWFFTADNLTRLVSYIATHGQPTDKMPVVKTTSDGYYALPAGAVAPSMMSASPAVSSIASGIYSSMIINWSPPSSTVPIHRYKVTLAQNGVLTQTLWVASGQGNVASLSGLVASDRNRVCVTPVNDIGGPATSIYGTWVTEAKDFFARPTIKGCTDFDNRTPAPVSNVAATIVGRTTSTVNVNATWVPQDTLTKSYRVTQTTVFPSGPKRVVTKDVGSPSMQSSVAKGSTVCTQVAALSAIKVASPSSASVCIIAN